jgi:peptide chain release factor 2
VIAELKSCKGPLESYRQLHHDLEEEIGMLELADPARDAAHIGEATDRSWGLESRLKKLSLRAVFSEADDRLGAFLSIHAGTGGTDACDWASMLLRMYCRWIERNGMTHQLIETYPGDETGYRRAVLEIQGEYAFGYLKSEIGVHRLVRISPFDANHRRHTAFCGVDVTPEQEEIQVDLNEKDLEVDVFSAGGPGGQHVNKSMTAIRIRHLPSGIVASCQNERSLGLNRKTAMKMLASRLHQAEVVKRKEALAKLYGDKGEISFGSQIRSYVMQPYTLVKDHRTEQETGNIQAVLDGEIDPFIEAFLTWKGRAY